MYLVYEERCQIYALKSSGMSIRSIARQLKRDQSVISREIKRNSENSVYNCEQAQIKAEFRRKNIQKTRITSDQINEVVSLITEC